MDKDIKNDNDDDHDIKRKIERIENKLDKILNILENSVDLNCKRMGHHITFIERIYENVKFPLMYICSIINNLSIGHDDIFLLE